jgi:isopenicillin-N epimerase
VPSSAKQSRAENNANPIWANPMWGDDWEDVRRLWPLDPDVAHCNHGSFGAVPSSVLATQNEFRDRMAANPMRWFHRDMPGLVAHARGEVARFIGGGPEGVAFVNNVSAGVSAVVQSLPLATGDEVLSTDHAYGAVSWALDRLCARTGAIRVVANVPLDSTDDEVVTRFAERCSARTGLVVVDQVTSPTARRFPIEMVARVAHSFDAPVLVDGAHAPGMLPLDVPAIGADFWVGNLHKWACAPAGTGALWVAPAWRERMLSVVVSWGEQDGFPLSFERVGTDDLSAWLAAPNSLELLGNLGWDRVREHNEALVCWAQATVAEILGVPSSELSHDGGLSMATVPLPAGRVDTREQAQAVQDHMVTRGVEMAIGCWNGRGRIRLSAYVYNSPSDYERMALGVRDFLAG